MTKRESQLSDLDRRFIEHVKHAGEKATAAKEAWQKRSVENYLEIENLKCRLDEVINKSVLMSDHCTVKYNVDNSEQNISSGFVNKIVLKFRNSSTYYSFCYEKSNILLCKFYYGDSEVKEKKLFDVYEIDERVEEIFKSYYYTYIKNCERASEGQISELQKGTYEKYVFIAVIVAFFAYLYLA